MFDTPEEAARYSDRKSVQAQFDNEVRRKSAAEYEGPVRRDGIRIQVEKTQVDTTIYGDEEFWTATVWATDGEVIFKRGAFTSRNVALAYSESYMLASTGFEINLNIGRKV